VSDLKITANGVEFTCLVEGPADGPLALLLHGFPDSAHTWRHLLPLLAERGFRAVAPFLRGYAPTQVPEDGRYQTGALVSDACALHEALGSDGRAVLVGHDWGAMAVYGAAAFAPERWSKVVGMAVPPAGAMAAGFMSYDQLRRSWYMFFFQSPLADIVVPMGDLAFIDRLWGDWSPGYDASDDLPLVKASLRDPANLEAAIGYYRATFDPSRQVPELAAEQAATSQLPPQPLLYLHGADDGCVGAELAGPDAVLVKGAGHFLHLEQPDEVNTRILDFLTA
jgi:pimeloyl-ACP methyl ester carboxylesterase